MNSNGKLKLFRSEAIHVGFSCLGKDKNYQAIADIAAQLPEQPHSRGPESSDVPGYQLEQSVPKGAISNG